MALLISLLFFSSMLFAQRHEEPTSEITEHNVEAERIYNSLRDQYYVQVSFDWDRQAAIDLIDAFYAYLALPDQIKNHMSYKIAPQHRRGELGLVHREPTNDGYGDKKDFFHYHPALRKQYQNFISQQPVVHRFIDLADNLWQKGVDKVKQTLVFLDDKFPHLSDKVFDTDEPHVVLRLVRYQWDQSQEFLAKPHFDAGSFTLAIAESGPGLRIGSKPENLTPVHHQPGKVLFFLASNFQSLAESKELLPGWHDVVLVDPSKGDVPFTRWAIVMFIDGHSSKAQSRNDTHLWKSAGIVEVSDRQSD